MELPAVTDCRKPLPIRFGQRISRPEVKILAQVLIEKLASVGIASADIYAVLPAGKGVRKQSLSVLVVHEIAHPFVVAPQ